MRSTDNFATATSIKSKNEVFFLKLRDTYRLNKDQIILFFVCQVCNVHNLVSVLL
jgi:hypothetical protein